MNDTPKNEQQAPGQQNAPKEGEPIHTPAEQTPEMILKGARNEDQLEQLKANAENGGETPAQHS